MSLFKDCCNGITNYIRNHDEITKPIASKLHMGGQKNSLMGGFISFAIAAYMAYVVVKKSYEMGIKWKPNINSNVQGYSSREHVPWTDMGRIAMIIYNGGDDALFERVPLDQESKRYISVKARHIVKTYENGIMNLTDTYYDLTQCTSDYYSNTDFEKKYYEEYIIPDPYHYCFEEPGVKLYGTRSSAV